MAANAYTMSNQSGYCMNSAAAYTSALVDIYMGTVILAVSILISLIGVFVLLV